MKQNRISNLLNIRYPIIQAPMNWVSGAALTAAVSAAGGLGTLGPNAGADKINSSVETTGEILRRQIQKVRSITEKPFAVNVAVGFGDDTKYSRKVVDVLIEEDVPVAIVSVGRPDVYTHTLKNAGIKVLHAISTVRHAQKAQEAGVDAVICEGFEAGGHKGFTELTTLVLTPMVADAVDIPVITGGGIGEGRGVIAALALGADGVYMGSRFMATWESESHENVKKAITAAKDVCTVSVPKDFMLSRDLTNRFTKKFRELRKIEASSSEMADFLKEHGQYQAQHLGQAEDSEVCCGQVAALIDEVLPAKELMERLILDIQKRMADLTQIIKIFY